MTEDDTASKSTPNLSEDAEKLLDFLCRHYIATGKRGVYKTLAELAEWTGLDSQQLSTALRELENAGIAGVYGQSRYGVPYVHLTKRATESISSSTITTTTAMHAGHSVRSSIPPVSTPLSHSSGTSQAPLPHALPTEVEAPRYLPDLQVHPPGRLHRVMLRLEGIVDPQLKHLLREAADKGTRTERNNRFGTKLPLSTWRISSKGRLALSVRDPTRFNEAIEEFARFCANDLGAEFHGTFSGLVACEVGYPVSGNVLKYAKCKVRVEVRGYRADVFFDKSPGDYELEVRAEGRGPPEALQSLTTMIVANGAMAKYFTDELPVRIAREIKRLEEW